MIDTFHNYVSSSMWYMHQRLPMVRASMLRIHFLKKKWTIRHDLYMYRSSRQLVEETIWRPNPLCFRVSFNCVFRTAACVSFIYSVNSINTHQPMGPRTERYEEWRGNAIKPFPSMHSTHTHTRTPNTYTRALFCTKLYRYVAFIYPSVVHSCTRQTNWT